MTELEAYKRAFRRLCIVIDKVESDYKDREKRASLDGLFMLRRELAERLYGENVYDIEQKPPIDIGFVDPTYSC